MICKWHRVALGLNASDVTISICDLKHDALSERTNPKSADALASTVSGLGCPPVAVARFWRADALEVASALPFELTEFAWTEAALTAPEYEETWGSQSIDVYDVVKSSEQY